MHTNMINFIEENADLIDSNQWEEVYRKLKFGPLWAQLGFTEAMMEAGINPLEYMDIIPINYLESAHIESFKIPDNIKEIGEGAFKRCRNLESVEIPEGVIKIREEAFAYTSLKYVRIPSTVKEIQEYAFAACDDLEVIDIHISTEVSSKAFWLSKNVTIQRYT